MDPFPWFQRWFWRALRLDQRPRLRKWLLRGLSSWVAFHALAVLLVGIPVPTPLNAAILERPSVTREVARWHERLSQVGYAGDLVRFERWLIEVSEVWSRGRNEVLAPFSAYLEAVRVRQAWYMFTAPDRTPERFRVEVAQAAPRRVRKRRAAHDWKPVFEEGRSLERPDLVSSGFLHHYRVRRALLVASWSQTDQHFVDLCAAFERRFASRDAALHVVRCTMIRQEVEHPGRVGVDRPSKTVRRLERRAKR